MSSMNIPITISPEVAAHVAELGLQGPFEQMLEHARQTVPGLQGIEVTLQPPYDLGGGPCVLIEPIMDDPNLEDDPTGRALGYWRVATFPPEVCQHFVFLCVYGPTDARQRVS